MKFINISILLLILFVFSKVSGQTDCIAKIKNNFNIDSSLVILENCVENSKNDTISFIKTNCHISSLLTRKSQYIKAEKKLFSLLALITQKRFYYLKGIIYNHLANNYKASFETSKALQFYLTAQNIFEKEKRYSELIRLYTDMAEFYRSHVQFADARKFIANAHKLCFSQATLDTQSLIRIYNRYAAIAAENSPSDSSVLFSVLALDLCRKTGNVYSEAISLNEVGFAMKNRKNVDSSMNCFKRAYDLWMKVGAKADAAHAKYNLALLLAHNNYPKKIVLPIYQEVVDMVTKNHVDYPLDQVYLGMSNCYFFCR